MEREYEKLLSYIKRDIPSVEDFEGLKELVAYHTRWMSTFHEAIFFEGAAQEAERLCEEKYGKEFTELFPDSDIFHISLCDEYSSEVDIRVYIFRNGDESAVFFSIEENPYYDYPTRPLDWDLKTAYLGKPTDEE